MQQATKSCDFQFCGVVDSHLRGENESGKKIVRIHNPDHIYVLSTTVADRIRHVICPRETPTPVPITVVKGRELRQLADRVDVDVDTIPDELVFVEKGHHLHIHTMTRATSGKKEVRADLSFTSANTLLTPSSYQKQLEKMLGPPMLPKRFLVYWSMGSGKTFGILNALRDVPYIIVICPITLISSSWLGALSSVRRGSEYQVIDVIGPTEAKQKKAADFFRNQVVVFDEVHELRNMTAYMDALFWNLHDARSLIGMSGTPMVNSPYEVDYIFRLLDPDWHAGVSTSSLQRLEVLCRGRVHYYTDTVSLPKIETTTVQVPMKNYQTLLYVIGMTSKFVVGDTAFMVPGTGNAYKTFEKQITNSYRVHGTNHIASPKADVCSANIAKLAAGGCLRQAVYCHYLQHQLEPLKDRLTKAGMNVYVVEGKTNVEDRTLAIGRYNRRPGPKDKGMVLIFSDAGYLGMSLKNSSHIHVLDIPDNKATYDQVIHRCARKDSHPRGSVLQVMVYISVFPDWVQREPRPAKELVSQFMELRRLKDPLDANQFMTSFLRCLRKKDSGKTVDETRWQNMEPKQTLIQPYLKVLQESGGPKKVTFEDKPVIITETTAASGKPHRKATPRTYKRGRGVVVERLRVRGDVAHI